MPHHLLHGGTPEALLHGVLPLLLAFGVFGIGLGTACVRIHRWWRSDDDELV